MPAPLHPAIARRFEPLLDDLVRRAAVADGIVDRAVFRILVCTLWVNVVLSPEDVGLREDQLEALHDVLNHRIVEVMGGGETLKACFRFLDSKRGQEAMTGARLTPEHRDLLLYFASMILDPDGHRRWMDDLRNRPER